MSERLFGKFLKGVDKDLVLEFLVAVSRMEYALKRAGFAKSRQDGFISICWKDFAKKIEKNFDATRSTQLLEAVEHLKTKSPKLQVISNKTLDWQPIKPKHEESELQFALRLVRTVRNNLFHGGKYPMDVVRDPKLLKSCIVVLSECRKLNDTVKKEFEDYK